MSASKKRDNKGKNKGGAKNKKHFDDGLSDVEPLEDSDEEERLPARKKRATEVAVRKGRRGLVEKEEELESSPEPEPEPELEEEIEEIEEDEPEQVEMDVELDEEIEAVDTTQERFEREDSVESLSDVRRRTKKARR